MFFETAQQAAPRVCTLAAYCSESRITILWIWSRPGDVVNAHYLWGHNERGETELAKVLMVLGRLHNYMAVHY